MCLRNYLQIIWSLRVLKHFKISQLDPQDLKYLDRKNISYPCRSCRHPHLNQITHRNYQRRQKGRRLNIQQSCSNFQRCYQCHRWLTRPRCWIFIWEYIIRLNRWTIYQTFEECYRSQEDQILRSTNGRTSLIILRRRWCWSCWATWLIIINLEIWSRRSMDCLWRIKRSLPIII